MGICLGNNQDNFQLHRFTRRDNTAKSLGGGGYFSLTHTVATGVETRISINVASTMLVTRLKRGFGDRPRHDLDIGYP